MKLRRTGLDRINLDRPDIIYQVISGAASDTFIVFAPLASLKPLDEALARFPTNADAGPRPGSKIASDIELSRENFLLRVDPRMSWVNESFVASDPEFWNPMEL